METAIERLKRMSAWDAEPELTGQELEALLAQAETEDAAGLSPGWDGWQPTYDLNAAAASAWLIKAGRAAGMTETEPESGQVSSRVFDNCRKMSRAYRALRKATVRITP